MEVNGGGGRRRVSREASPDRARGVGFAERQGGRVVRGGGLGLGLARRVQIVYYLSRNGQLEHPHFMELSQFPNQQLRLKDVMERLTVLRGKGMPSLFSWSCKRSYKNGYVWNDLSENDIIYPADGAEYVLKGSELIAGCSERFQQLRISSRPRKPLPPKHQIEPEDEEEEVDEEEEETDEDDQEIQEPEVDKNRHTRCSRGVSTDEIPNVLRKTVLHRGARHQTEIAVDDGSPPSSSSSDPPTTVEPASLATRNSVFLNLIACGSTAAGTKGRRSGGDLQKKGLVSRVAARACRVENGEEEEAETFMTENARNGNVQSEEKQYFSGSIVEAMRSCAGEPAGLKKSSSYNEERSSKLGIGEECLGVGGEEQASGGVKGKCIPGRKKTSKLQEQQQQQSKK